MSRHGWGRRAALAGLATAAGATGLTLAAGAQGASSASSAEQSVIVVLKDQHASVPADSRHLSARRAAVRSDQQPLESSVSRSGGTVTHSYQTLNGFAADVGAAEAKKLAADPAVAQVIPDARVRAPDLGTPPAAGATSSRAVTPTTPPPGVCPTNGQPFANTEALDAVKAVNPGSDGSGVKVAFFAEGIDVNNPDFRRNGSTIFSDYRDFTGEGTAAPTTGGEAFLDATSIAAQGNVTYDIHDRNPGIPVGCTTRIKGVAPGASLVALKVFGEQSGGDSATVLAAEDYAITTDKVDVINLSLGSDLIPDTDALDALKVFDAQAVQAGVTVTISSGDQGPANTVSSPAGGPGVITLGASTTFRDYFQNSSRASNFATSWASNELSQLSSAGINQSGHTVDLLAPGDSTLTACTADLAMYSDCSDILGTTPLSTQYVGGTSESAPLTAGAAADVISAYRAAHGGASPTPAQVKGFITGTATDLGRPGQDQGAGLLDVSAAVRAAQGGATAGVTASPSQVTVEDAPGSTTASQVSVTNDSSAPQTVTASSRRLGAAQPLTSGTADLETGKNQFTDFDGEIPRAATTVAVPVPAGKDQLNMRIAWPDPDAEVELALISPTGVYSGYSRSAAGIGYAAASVRRPAAGNWQAVIFTTDGKTGYSGPVTYQTSTATFGAGGAVSPASLTLGPGETKSVSVTTTLPGSPGDSEQDLVLHSGSENKDTVVPVVGRALVPTDGGGGSFSGSLVAGNRLGQEDTYDIDVPAGAPGLTVGVAFDTDAEEITGTLVDPDGNVVSNTSNVQSDQNGPKTTDTLVAARVAPKAGRWRFVLNELEPGSGTDISVGYQGKLGFDLPEVTPIDVPASSEALLAAGQPATARVHVLNTTPSVLPLVLDPRAGDPIDQPLAVENDVFAAEIAASDPNIIPFVVPPQTSALTATATTDNPIRLGLDAPSGDPQLVSRDTGTSLSLGYSGDELQNGTWGVVPVVSSTAGFGDDGAPDTKVDATLTARTPAFDTSVDTSTGDPWLASVDPTADTATPVSLKPGKSIDLDVTITPQGPDGTSVAGSLNLLTYNLATGSGDTLARIPYSYTIGTPAQTPGPDQAQLLPPTPQQAVKDVLSAKLTRTGTLGIRDLLRFSGETELFTPPGAGSLHISWKTKGNPRVTLATATKAFTAGGLSPVKVRVKLSKTGRRYLRHRTKVSFTETVSFTPTGGTAVTSSVSRSLKRG